MVEKSKLRKVLEKLPNALEGGVVRVEKGIHKSAGKKVVSKKIGKKSTVMYKMPDYKKESVLGDTNRFFKGEMEEAKKSLFLR